MIRKAIFIWALAAAIPAAAGPKFLAYEGQDQFIEGQGGTRVTTDGIDFWTSGTPTRRSKVIGRITDKRGTGAVSGSAVGSSSVAKLVRERGGDAVILDGVREDNRGFVMSGNMAFAARKAITEMIVVKYID